MFHELYDTGFCVYAVDPYKRDDELVAFSVNVAAANAAMQVMREARPHCGLQVRCGAMIQKKLEPLKGWRGKPPPNW